MAQTEIEEESGFSVIEHSLKFQKTICFQQLAKRKFTVRFDVSSKVCLGVVRKCKILNRK